jgi:hypothetical protein
MIIKYRNIEDRWNWFSKVDEVNTLGYMPIEDMPQGDEVSVLGIKMDEHPYVLHVCKDGQRKVLALYAQEAYLTEDSTGNTIDVLIPKKIR